ncbi:hypothetical protein ACFQJC_05515 [Haloferax namakaokahaiae]|uniref:Uncharacterized protein n=1 Tax=Haloferax namakaokahaiae TaxID=1748331 RepID=A0ABD5ZD94_9EURY
MEWSPRAILGSLQLPVAGVGFGLLVLTLLYANSIPPSPPQSDGFVEGLAGFFILVFGAIGFVLLVAGLLIPPGPGYGIHFTRKQRWLFAYALAAPLVGVGAFLASLTLSAAVGGLFEAAVSVFFVALSTAPLALLAGLGWKAVQVATARI